MKIEILYFLLLSSCISCADNSKNTQKVNTYKPQVKEQSETLKSIRFDFSANRINTYRETIEIKATLYNDDIDTVYFLTSTCDGEQYSLQYDTTRFHLTPFLLCNASYLKIAKIHPKGQYDFSAHLRASSIESKIKLGFDLYKVDRDFRLDDNNSRGLNVFNRPLKEQNIIWAEEKNIN